MSKEITKTVTKKSSGVLAGLFFLVIGIGILWYNEGRTVKTQSAIGEAKKNFITVKSDKVDSKNEGKLVATKGKINLEYTEDLSDSRFGITAKAAKLKRTVEMYQWEESCETNENDEKTCKYEKIWKDTLIDSSEFEKSGHDNPNSMPYESEVFIADNVKLGAFTLPEELINSLRYNKKKHNDELLNEYKNNIEGIKVVGDYLTNVKEEGEEIGDIRISYQYLTEKNVSVLAVQTGDTFEAFTSKKGKDIYKIVDGNKTGIQILESMSKSNKAFKWFLRFLGVFVVISAFNSMFNFINKISSKVPVLGTLVNGATSLVSTIFGLAVSLIVIAIAWFRFRPIISLILIVVVVSLLLFLKFYKKDEKKETESK